MIKGNRSKGRRRGKAGTDIAGRYVKENRGEMQGIADDREGEGRGREGRNIDR